MEFQGTLCFFFLLTFLSSSQAHKFNVGGSQGWVPNPSESYNNWAGRNRFQINDTIVFKYKKGSDSVLEVKKEDYDKCNKTNPIKKFENGDTEFKFDRSGPFYFISGKDGNCEKGQKLTVVVLSPRTPPTPKTPPPKSSPSPSPSPSPKSSPPKSSPPSPTISPSPVAQPPSLAPSPASSPVPSGGPPAPTVMPPANSPAPTVGPPAISPGPSGEPPASSPVPSGKPPASSPVPSGGPPVTSPLAPPPGSTSSPPAPGSAGPSSPTSQPPSSNATAPPPKNSGTSVSPSIVLVYFVTLVSGAVLLRY